MEVLITKASPEASAKLQSESLVVVSDFIPFLSGNTISYLEFSQGMVANKTLIREIYDPISTQKAVNLDLLKEIASEQASSTLLIAAQTKKTNKKKKAGKWHWY